LKKFPPERVAMPVTEAEGKKGQGLREGRLREQRILWNQPEHKG